MKENTLAYKFPAIAKEWDYLRNGELAPETVTAGSKKEVYWICPKCGQSYMKRICNRTSPSKRNAESEFCPVCLGRKIIPGFNSLKARHPSIVENEWDYDKNDTDPDQIAPHTSDKYWWKCSRGHSYEASCNNKVNGNGGNCPYCSKQRLLPENSLATKFPDIAKEFDLEQNAPKTPDQFAAFSNRRVYWLCPKCGHSWNSTINNRTSLGRGCPNCIKGKQSSYPEQFIYQYLNEVCEAQNRVDLNGQEVDVFLPEYNTCIEYDGEYYHGRDESSYQRDIRKSKHISDLGYRLIRIREEGCFMLPTGVCEVVSVKYTSVEKQMAKRIISALDVVLPQLKVTESGLMLEELINRAKNACITTVYKKSFEYYRKQCEDKGEPLNAIWDIEANLPLQPSDVTPYSDREVHWICINDRNHKWRAPVKSISKGWGCRRCAKRHPYSTSEWIEKARSIHGAKFDYSKVEYVNAKTKVQIICSTHGTFEQMPSEHLTGKGCPYCSGNKFHPLESLANRHPELLKDWDYEKNNEKPTEIRQNSGKKYWWKCNNGKPHSYTATIWKRLSGGKCAVCHGKQVSYDMSVACLRPDLAKEWSPNNKYIPSEVSLGSDKEIEWCCPNPEHPNYKLSVYRRSKQGAGCPLCRKISQELK